MLTGEEELVQLGVNRTPSHVTFSRVCAHVQWCLTRHWLKCLCASSHPCLMRLCVWSLFALFICLSRLLLHPPDLSLLLWGCCRSKIPCALRRMRSLAFWPTTLLAQVMSPTSSTTTTSQRPLNFLSGVLQRQQALDLAWLGDQWLHHRPVGYVRTERPVNELSLLSSSVRENPSRDSENEQIRLLLERQRGNSRWL